MTRQTGLEDVVGTDHRATRPAIRYHYMDNLRAWAMLAGVFFHAALAYSPLFANLWLTADAENARVYDAVAWFSHLFRMPLFFLIAGFFTAYLLGKRGSWGLIRNRLLRVALPLLLFLPLVLWAMMAGIGWAVFNVEAQSPMLKLIAWSMNMPNPEPPPFSFMHLWFLYQLLMLYGLFLCLRGVGLLGRFSPQAGLPPWVIVWLLPLVLIPFLLSQSAPFPAPEGLMPQWWAIGYFGVFFLFGSHLFAHQGLLDRLRRWAPWLLLASLGLYGAYEQLMPKSISMAEIMRMGLDSGIEWSSKHVALAILGALVSWWMVLCCLIFGRMALNRASRVMRFIADASYWIYLMHLPVLMMIQYWLLDQDWAIWLKFLIASGGTLFIGFISYVLIIRWTPIGWMLNGRKRRSISPR